MVRLFIDSRDDYPTGIPHKSNKIFIFMSKIITAIYANGVLRPLSPLNVPENTTVQIQILTKDPILEKERLVQYLAAAGLITPPSHRNDVEPVSEEAWRELTQRLEISEGKPLSEIIIEERGPL